MQIQCIYKFKGDSHCEFPYSALQFDFLMMVLFHKAHFIYIYFLSFFFFNFCELLLRSECFDQWWREEMGSGRVARWVKSHGSIQSLKLWSNIVSEGCLQDLWLYVCSWFSSKVFDRNFNKGKYLKILIFKILNNNKKMSHASQACFYLRAFALVPGISLMSFPLLAYLMLSLLPSRSVC